MISIYLKKKVKLYGKRENCKASMVLLHKMNRTIKVHFMGHCSQHHCCLEWHISINNGDRI